MNPNVRKANESYAKYRARRTAQNAALKERLKGRLVVVAESGGRSRRRHQERQILGHPNKGLSKAGRHIVSHCKGIGTVIPGERAERKRLRDARA